MLKQQKWLCVSTIKRLAAWLLFSIFWFRCFCIFFTSLGRGRKNCPPQPRPSALPIFTSIFRRQSSMLRFLISTFSFQRFSFFICLRRRQHRRKNDPDKCRGRVVENHVAIKHGQQKKLRSQQHGLCSNICRLALGPLQGQQCPGTND